MIRGLYDNSELIRETLQVIVKYYSRCYVYQRFLKDDWDQKSNLKVTAHDSPNDHLRDYVPLLLYLTWSAVFSVD